VRLGLGRGSVDLSSLLRGASANEVRTVKVKLSCLRAAGADLGAVEEPMILSTSGRAVLTLVDARIAPNTGDAVCPAS
jgi:beta-glucosidase